MTARSRNPRPSGRGGSQPSAPVEVLNRPTTLFTPDEKEAQQRRIEREQARLARDADKIAKALTHDGSEFKVSFVSQFGFKERESFKTERAATTWLVSEMVNHQYWHKNEPSEGQRDAYESIKSAIADKHGMSADEVEEMLASKVAAKAKRDGLI